MRDLIEDLAWAWQALRARRARRGLSYLARRAFDGALRPSGGGVTGRPREQPEGAAWVVSYPDAFYHLSAEDVDRAVRRSSAEGSGVPAREG